MTVTLSDGSVVTFTGAPIGDKHWIQVAATKDAALISAKTQRPRLRDCHLSLRGHFQAAGTIAGAETNAREETGVRGKSAGQEHKATAKASAQPVISGAVPASGGGWPRCCTTPYCWRRC